MSGFFINGLDLPLGQGHIVISGVDKGIGTTIGVSGKFVDNTAPGPSLVVVRVSRYSYTDPGQACTIGQGDPMVELYLNKKYFILYNDSEGTVPFSGASGRYYFSTDGTILGAPTDASFLQISSDGQITGMVMPC